jgi:hypothetical protein
MWLGRLYLGSLVGIASMVLDGLMSILLDAFISVE